MLEPVGERVMLRLGGRECRARNRQPAFSRIPLLGGCSPFVLSVRALSLRSAKPSRCLLGLYLRLVFGCLIVVSASQLLQLLGQLLLFLLQARGLCAGGVQCSLRHAALRAHCSLAREQLG